MEVHSHSQGLRKAHGHWFLQAECRFGAWKALLKERQDKGKGKGNPPTHSATGARQIPVAVAQQLPQPQQRGNLHLHELKDLSNEHTGEAILLMQVIDVKATVKEKSLEIPSL